VKLALGRSFLIGRLSVCSVTVVFAALVISGCGGSEAHYSLAATKTCLGRLATIQPAGTYGPAKASTKPTESGSAWRLPDGNQVSVFFFRTGGDAEQELRIQASISSALGQPPSDVMWRRGNAMIMWEHRPLASQRKAVDHCLA
jgi:hypothetical protein